MNTLTPVTLSECPSPLRKAIIDDDLATVRNLVNEDVDVNQLDKEGWSPLALATSHRRIPIMKMLIEAGAYLDQGTSFGTAAIFHAASGPDQSTEALQLLIEAGADITEPLDNDGRSPLQQAIIENLTAKVRLLLEAGADVHYEDHDGCNSLFYACMADGEPDEEIVRMLLDKGADPLWANQNGTTPIYHARSRGMSEFPIIDLMVRAAERQSLERP